MSYLPFIFEAAFDTTTNEIELDFKLTASGDCIVSMTKDKIPFEVGKIYFNKSDSNKEKPYSIHEITAPTCRLVIGSSDIENLTFPDKYDIGTGLKMKVTKGGIDLDPNGSSNVIDLNRFKLYFKISDDKKLYYEIIPIV